MAGAGAVLWPFLTSQVSVAGHGVGLPCPLRTLTGIPCPACGLTTAAVALVRGEFTAALAANPVIYGLAALAVAAGPLVALRALGVLEQPRPWSPRRRRVVVWLSGLLAVASWLFQLHRLGVSWAT